jgi:hypothetical protein
VEGIWKGRRGFITYLMSAEYIELRYGFMVTHSRELNTEDMDN